MVNKSKSINLIRKGQQNFLDDFINWALSIGRLIVILTEIIALSAFLYRFSLDRKLIDLHEKIAQKQTIVKLLKGNEDKFRNLQERIALASTFSASGDESSKIFKDILSFIPQDVDISNLILSEESIKIDSSSSSIASIKNFITEIRAYPKVKSISLDKIENKTSSGIIAVTITVNLQKTK